MELADNVLARAARFREDMAALYDWAHTVVVSRWAFIMSMTGRSVEHGEWLACDPREPELRDVVWKHHQGNSTSRSGWSNQASSFRKWIGVSGRRRRAVSSSRV